MPVSHQTVCAVVNPHGVHAHVQIVLLLASALRSCPAPDSGDEHDPTSSVRAYLPQVAAPPLSPRASGGVPASPRAAAEKPRSSDAAPASSPRASAIAATAPPRSLAMRMLDAALSNAGMRRRERRPEESATLAAHTFQTFAPLGQDFCADLLQVCPSSPPPCIARLRSRQALAQRACSLARRRAVLSAACGIAERG